MNSFERALFGKEAQIPIHEASSFFLSMKQPSFTTKVARAMSKTAGWQDPPDETGLLEGQFEVPVENAVQLMGKCAMYLLRIMNAGLIYSRSIRGPFAAEVRDAVRHGEWDHQHAFEYLIERMTVLLGAPHIPEIDMPPPSTDPLAVAQRMIRAEQEMINSYHELLAVTGRNPMHGKVKCFMGQCQEHLDTYWMALPPDYGNKTMLPKPADMLATHEERESPEMEAIESPEFEAAEQAAGVEPPEHGSPAIQASALSKIAARMVKWAKETPSDAELKETGRQRAVATVAAEHHRETARRGERTGRGAGMVVGGALGGLAGHAVGKGHHAALLGGALLGGLAGRHIGAELGTEHDIAKHRAPKESDVSKVAAALVAWVKKADDAITGMQAAEAPMASPTDNQELAPVNYMQAEALGRHAQNQNEANYYKQQVLRAQQQAQQAQQATAQAQAQVQQITQQAAQAQQDASVADMKVKAALNEAVGAKQDALKQTETAARMRIAQQNLRMQLMQLAAEDPDMQAAMNLAQTTGQASAMGASVGEVMAPDAGLAAGPPNAPAQGEGGGGPPGGPAGAAPDQQTPPGAAPPAGSPDQNANASGAPGPSPDMAYGTSQLSNKTSSARRRMQKVASNFDDADVAARRQLIRSAASFSSLKIAGLIGAGLGGIAGGTEQALRTRASIKAGVTPSVDHVAALSAAQDGGYQRAAALAAAKSALAQRELAVAHPTQAVLHNAFNGTLRGATVGHSIETSGRTLYDLLSS